jgi:hypothetical protein
LGPLAAAGQEEIEPATFTPRERAGDTIEAEEIVNRLDDPNLVLGRAPACKVARRGEPDRQGARAGFPAP